MIIIHDGDLQPADRAGVEPFDFTSSSMDCRSIALLQPPDLEDRQMEFVQGVEHTCQLGLIADRTGQDGARSARDPLRD